MINTQMGEVLCKSGRSLGKINQQKVPMGFGMGTSAV